MRILVCGGRDFGNLTGITKLRSPELYKQKLEECEYVSNTLSWLAEKYSKYYVEDENWLPADITIIQGGATGADRCAEEWATINYCHIEEFVANWQAHGKSAGYIRNKQMLNEGKPELVVAFPGGTGTADMVRQAKAAGIEVLEIPYGES